MVRRVDLVAYPELILFLGFMCVFVPLCRQSFISLQTFMGVILGSAVVPIALCVTWTKANRMGCIVGSVAGFVLGIIAILRVDAGIILQ